MGQPERRKNKLPFSEIPLEKENLNISEIDEQFVSKPEHVLYQNLNMFCIKRVIKQ